MATVGIDIYGTFAQAQAYHAMRGNAAWATMTEADGNILLVKGTDYIERSFYGQWRGDAVPGNVLAWDRLDAFDDADQQIIGIPDLLIRAMAEVAEIIRSGVDLNTVLTDDAAIKRTKVDVIEVEYDTTARLRGAPIPVHVFRMLEPLLVGAGQLLRA